MKCIIPAQNVKILARCFHSLSRVGDELFVDPLVNGLSLCTVNASQSAFAEFVFRQSFFSSYSVGVATPEILPKCKISMRSCLSVFKSPHSMDKMVDWCQLRLEPESVQFIFQVKFSGGSTKTYFLPIIECESLQVKYNKTDSINLVASSKLLSGVIKNFRLSEDEITLSINKQNTTFRNHIDTVNERNKTVRTELGLLAGEFETYSVNQSIAITFCLKQLRALLAFAEPSGLPIMINVEAPGRPVIFTVRNESVYEANFVVSSLQSTVNSQNQDSQKSVINSDVQRQPQERPHERSKENFSREPAIPTCSKNIHLSNGDNRSLHKEILHDTQKNIVINSHNTVVSESTQDTVLFENNELFESMPGSPQNGPQLLVNNVFGRCFNSTFQKNLLPGFSNVIAYDSDGLEDSD